MTFNIKVRIDNLLFISSTRVKGVTDAVMVICHV